MVDRLLFKIYLKLNIFPVIFDMRLVYCDMRLCLFAAFRFWSEIVDISLNVWDFYLERYKSFYVKVFVEFEELAFWHLSMPILSNLLGSTICENLRALFKLKCQFSAKYDFDFALLTMCRSGAIMGCARSRSAVLSPLKTQLKEILTDMKSTIILAIIATAYAVTDKQERVRQTVYNILATTIFNENVKEVNKILLSSNNAKM